LNFVSILLENLEAGPVENDMYQDFLKKFLNDHLRNWVPRFTQDLENSANSSQYQSLARATREVVQAKWCEPAA